MKHLITVFLLVVFADSLKAQTQQDDNNPDYQTTIAPLLTKYCVACHNADEAEGGLNLETFESMMQGGKGHHHQNKGW